MAPVITSLEQLRALAAEHDAREAIAFAATGPVEQAAAVPLRRIAAEAPALPPLRMPKLSDRTLNGARVDDLMKAGRKAALLHTPRGIRVVPDLDVIAEDPEAIVIARYREVARRVTIDGKTHKEVATEILDRELDVLARLEQTAA